MMHPSVATETAWPSQCDNSSTLGISHFSIYRAQSDCGTPTKERSAAAEDRGSPVAVEGGSGRSLEQRLEEGLAQGGGGGWRSFVSGAGAAFDVEGGPRTGA